MENYAQVVHQMEEFGVKFRGKDLPLMIGSPKRRGCGEKGKWWYWLQLFHPDAGGSYIVGKFGSYKTGESQKVEVDWKPLNDAERKRLQDQRDAAAAAAEQIRQQEADFAALSASELWSRASIKGKSPYLERKGVIGESCRYLAGGDIVIPLLRYDLPRESALRGLQRIRADGTKLYTPGLAKAGCALRIGDVLPGSIVLICEGYATGLTLRMATQHELAVYVALDAGNLRHVVPIVAWLHPASRVLICADDDHLTRDQVTGRLNNPGLTAAKKAMKDTRNAGYIWPVFDSTRRTPKDTDFNDLHMREGLAEVSAQVNGICREMEKYYG